MQPVALVDKVATELSPASLAMHTRPLVQDTKNSPAIFIGTGTLAPCRWALPLLGAILLHAFVATFMGAVRVLFWSLVL